MVGQWRFYIDRGGTFTDIVAEAPNGALSTLKLLSEDPRYEDAAMEGIGRFLDLPAGAAIPATRIAEVRMGTTVATNALLERKGARTVLVTTRGFKDQLRIGYQNRPKLFALNIELPQVLYGRVIEAGERVTADGEILDSFDGDTLADQLRKAKKDGFTACAILFMHGYRYPAHESRAAEIARGVGFSQISTSHDTVPLQKFVSRGGTTVADAYLSPKLKEYSTRIEAALGKSGHLFFMTSNGGLAAAGHFRGRDAILSGPAGGVVGMAETAREAGFSRVIGFDMGGTSTDVSRFDGTFERVYESEVAGVRLRAPMMAIHTVAAGGGSILSYDGARFRAGPESAGADPGPMSYRRGGPLTVTDANVMAGKLSASFFPALFGPKGNQGLDEDAVRRAFADLARQIGDGRTPEEVADGFIRIAVENMAHAIKRISVARGYDARDYVLNCFGGAGGQHACLVADALGITRIFIHPFSGVLSAYGMKQAQLRAIRQRAIGRVLDGALLAEAKAMAEELSAEADAEIIAQGAQSGGSGARVQLAYEGSDTTLAVPLADETDLRRAFAELHARQFGFGFAGKRLIVDSLEVEAVSAQVRKPARAHSGLADRAGAQRSRFYSQGRWHDAALLTSERLKPGKKVAGPALIVKPQQTVVVEPGWTAEMIAGRALLLSREASRQASRAGSREADPVLLEVFANLFMAIAEEMGVTLQNTAASVNIKERLDFSCAIFDAEGGLVANAPHMPVHLGSMGDCVTAIIAKHGNDIAPGDVFVTNAPYHGGTHLPDITVVAPVFLDGKRQFFTAARGHHADIGGITPGSMPPFSREIGEEGILFDGLRMIRGGVFDEAAVRRELQGGKYPARNPEQNIPDLKAQAAACARGEMELTRAAALHGTDLIVAYMRHVQDNAEEAVRRAIGALKDGAFEMPMDGGITIRVKVTVDRAKRSAYVDFTGTSPQQPNNLNAPGSVTKAAVLYVFRCLVGSDIPMNAGCLRPIEIVVPEGSLLNPRSPGAVAGGNVETSSAVVDALFGALGVMAAAQGTMNNVTFGNARHQYYETVCGGAGAGASFDGASAVHTHMTNTRLTDPEVLESRFPVLVEEFSIREGSGGAGAHRGGDGVVRRIRFREAMTAAILSTRRETEPFGLYGGKPGLMGVNAVIRANGERLPLKGRDDIAVEPGDALEVMTPGGGGFGT